MTPQAQQPPLKARKHLSDVTVAQKSIDLPLLVAKAFFCDTVCQQHKFAHQHCAHKPR
jgi:hypothetical protein